MIHGSFILADDSDALIKILIFGIAGAIWLIGQVAKASSKSAKKTAARPPAPPILPHPLTMSGQSAPRRGAAAGFPPPPAAQRSSANLPLPARLQQPPLATIIGRPGGPATTLQDARRLAQARAVQARAAAARAGQLQAAQARAAQAQAAQKRAAAFSEIPAFPPPPPRRGEAAASPPAATPFATQPLSRPLAQSAPASAVTAPAVRRTAPPPPTRAAAPIVSATRGPAVRPNLTPQSLRSQFILTEILAPPVTLRQ